jgi:hypothetical protein
MPQSVIDAVIDIDPAKRHAKANMFAPANPRRRADATLLACCNIGRRIACSLEFSTEPRHRKLAVASLIVMPAVSWGKLRAATHLGSAALGAEAKETLACSYLSFSLLLGLTANATLGWWWADPAAALLMVPWLLKEGREGLRGETCCQD